MLKQEHYCGQLRPQFFICGNLKGFGNRFAGYDAGEIVRRRSTIAANNEPLVNENITAKEVRLINENGDQVGIVAIDVALRMAEEAGYDLVNISPKADPPVCRIMDYGKYKYEQSKKEREAKKNQRTITVKEVKLRPNIEDHDFQTKAKNAAKFLSGGDKVKVTIMFRGREITHPELGQELCERFAEELSSVAKVEKAAKVEGRNMIMILAPARD